MARGCIFQMSYKVRDSNVDFLKDKNGKPMVEATNQTSKKTAENILAQKIANVLQGKYPGLIPMTFEQRAHNLEEHYRLNGIKHGEKFDGYYNKHLKPFFGGLRAQEITTTKIIDFPNHRLNENLKPATITRMLSSVKRMFRLAAQETPPRVH